MTNFFRVLGLGEPNSSEANLPLVWTGSMDQTQFTSVPTESQQIEADVIDPNLPRNRAIEEFRRSNIAFCLGNIVIPPIK